jgi:NADP-dependent 3-hydroxy acid dehydrogenase YdfG
MISMQLKGKIAWITGGGSGIGLAGAKALAAEGATVILSGREAAKLESAAAQVRAFGTCETHGLDVSVQANAAQVANAILAQHGAIDILVNSAGTNVPKRFWNNIEPADFDKVLSINLNGAMYCMLAVLPGMRARKTGTVINIASWAGKFTSYFTGPAYQASKAGLVHMTYALNAEECVNNIRATVISPGEVATPILKSRPIPPSDEEMAKMLQAEDLGETIRYVACLPQRACVSEIVIAPTHNRIILGAADIPKPKPA